MPRTIQEILDHAEELADHFEHNPPDPADMVDATALHAVRDAVVNRAKAEEAIVTAVEAARAAGHTWPRIGAILGTSGEAARQRYGQSKRAKSGSGGAVAKKGSGKTANRGEVRAKGGRIRKKNVISKQAQRS